MLPLHNKLYRIDHIMKRFREENSIMSGLLNQNNLLLCGIQGLLMFDMHSILSTPASDVLEWLKTTGTAIKIAREPTNNKKYI